MRERERKMYRKLGDFSMNFSKHFQFPFQTKQTAVNTEKPHMQRNTGKEWFLLTD